MERVGPGSVGARQHNGPQPPRGGTSTNVQSLSLQLSTHLFEQGIEHPARAGDYMKLVWLTSALATLGGALDAGRKSNEAVRGAAYTYRPTSSPERGMTARSVVGRVVDYGAVTHPDVSRSGVHKPGTNAASRTKRPSGRSHATRPAVFAGDVRRRKRP
jgi:hypothetical protein